jgi:hypothetical protein
MIGIEMLKQFLVGYMLVFPGVHKGKITILYELDAG